jgi:hypothetical protein
VFGKRKFEGDARGVVVTYTLVAASAGEFSERDGSEIKIEDFFYVKLCCVFLALEPLSESEGSTYLF